MATKPPTSYFWVKIPLSLICLVANIILYRPKTSGRIDVEVYAATGLWLSNLFTVFTRVMTRHSECGQHKLKHAKTTFDYIRDGKSCIHYTIHYVNQCIQNKNDGRKRKITTCYCWSLTKAPLLLPNFLQRLALLKDLRFPVAPCRQRQPSRLGAPRLGLEVCWENHL